MPRKIVALVASYRKAHVIDTLTDAVLEAAAARGAQCEKIYLVDRHIEYCTNCRSCTQQPGPAHGACVLHDDMPEILASLDAADVIILASPVNFWNTTAVFRTFLERTVGAVYWPWGGKGPQVRNKDLKKKAILIASLAAPGFLLPLMTGAPRALRSAAECLGAKPVAHLWAGLAANEPQPKLSDKLLARARQIGAGL